MKTNIRSAILFAFATVNVIATGWAQNQCSRGGSCISIYECPPLLSLLQSKFLTQSIVNTLRQAQCSSPSSLASGQQSSSYVCCDVFPTQATIPVQRNDPIKPVQLSNPSYGQGAIMPEECGVESTTRKIIGGVGVELDEFPWMAILEYERRELKITYRNL